MTHICVNKLISVGSDNGLSPARHRVIIWTNTAIFIIRTSGTLFSEILIEIHIYPFTKMHLKMSSGKWRPFCLGLNVLMLFIMISIWIRLLNLTLTFYCTLPETMRDPTSYIFPLHSVIINHDLLSRENKSCFIMIVCHGNIYECFRST